MTNRVEWLITQLTTDWSIGGDTPGTVLGTNNPIIDKVNNHKGVRLQYSDYILLYEIGEPHDPLGIGGKEWTEATTISVDIRTSTSATRLENMKDEVISIVDGLQHSQDTMWRIHIIRKQELSDKSVGMWRAVVDVLVEQQRNV